MSLLWPAAVLLLALAPALVHSHCTNGVPNEKGECPPSIYEREPPEVPPPAGSGGGGAVLPPVLKETTAEQAKLAYASSDLRPLPYNDPGRVALRSGGTVDQQTGAVLDKDRNVVVNPVTGKPYDYRNGGKDVIAFPRNDQEWKATWCPAQLPDGRCGVQDPQTGLVEPYTDQRGGYYDIDGNPLSGIIDPGKNTPSNAAANGGSNGASTLIAGSLTPPPASPAALAAAREEEQRAGSNASAGATRRLAAHYLRAGSPEDAERIASEAVAAHPEDERAWLLRARARAMKGDADGSVDDARRAVALDPNDRVAAAIAGHRDELKKAAAKFKSFRPALGETAYADGAGEAPGQAAPSMLAGLAPAPEPRGGAPGLAELSPSQRAQREQALATVTPLQVKAFSRYKDAYDKATVGDFTGALLPAMQALDLAEGKAKAKPLVLKAFVENRIPEQPPAALQDAQQALAIEPENAAALREKAYAELQTGQVPAARVDIEHALALEPGSGLGLYYRGLVGEKEGRLADAQADFARAVSAEPALKALVAPAMARLAPPPSPTRRGLFRGGAIAASLLLVLFGMLGTATGQKAVTTARTLFGRKGAALPTVPQGAADVASTGALLAGNYRLSRELGRGGMGVVYEAMDEALQRTVAVKRLQRENGFGAEDMQRLLQEARLVAKLKHPRIAEIYNVVEDGDLYLIFEYVDGKPLDRALVERVRLSTQEARRALGDIAAAIGYAHSQKVIHRDLKPSNVMIEAGGNCKVMDFGIAHQSNAATVLTRTSASGTPPYMPPEQMMGSVSKASDLYALGVMAYELLAGKRPFDGPDFLEQKLNRQFAPPSALGLPAKLDGFFARALEPDPTKRHASAEEFLAALDAALF